MAATGPDQLLTLAALANHTGLSERHLRREVNAGRLLAYRPGRTWIRVKWQDYETWLEAQRMPLPGPRLIASPSKPGDPHEEREHEAPEQLNAPALSPGLRRLLDHDARESSSPRERKGRPRKSRTAPALKKRK